MYKVEAIVREEKLEDVKNALADIEVRGMTIYQVMGCGTQMGYTENVRGNKISVMMQPKIKFEIFVSNEKWADATADAIEKAAKTGETGDGKIICYPISSIVRIRTGETGYDAIQPGPAVINKI